MSMIIALLALAVAVYAAVKLRALEQSVVSLVSLADAAGERDEARSAADNRFRTLGD